MPQKRAYTWRRDLSDQRDFILELEAGPLPAKVDLRPSGPAVYDQGQVGSSTSNAGAAALVWAMSGFNLPQFEPSRLFIYYNERRILGTERFDAGSTNRTLMKSLAKYGAARESEWPYRAHKFTVKPGVHAYEDARDRTISIYFSVPQDLDSMRGALALGQPVVVGLSIHESFESPHVEKTGVIPMPEISERLLGGQSMLIVGYDDDEQCFIVRNSWGKDWGDDGHCWVPYDYLVDPNLAGDMWTIRRYSAS